MKIIIPTFFLKELELSTILLGNSSQYEIAFGTVHAVESNLTIFSLCDTTVLHGSARMFFLTFPLIRDFREKKYKTEIPDNTTTTDAYQICSYQYLTRSKRMDILNGRCLQNELQKNNF